MYGQYFDSRKKIILLKKENIRLKDRISHLEKNARDEANKSIILQSLLNQREK
jgi:hypothetical protein